MIETNGEKFYRICVKLYAREAEGVADDAALFVPILHEWIRDRALDVVLVDVADYAHVPDSPGIVLVAHEAHFALDRSDGRFGLLAQRRTPFKGSTQEGIAETLRQVLQIVARLEADPRVKGKLSFDPSLLRVEANDRLVAPNTAEGFAAFEPLVRNAVAAVFSGAEEAEISRVENDPRDRLALEVRVPTAALAGEPVGVG